ncbi:MAG: hypothetical protein H6624_17885 [Bdellovibrionaceae bacterium]|nr:hypothetical protein [Bdellovibrionales bacterium]MCB9086216.1 hypothetical protein [Pseudobdellovibrionaceae bacterium]
MSVVTLLSSCQTTPTRYEDKNEGYWQTKVLIKDKKKNKSYIVHVDMNARVGENLRLDVTTPLGGHLASLVLNSEEVRYVVVKQKKFYSGKPTPKALQPLISVPLDPVLMYNILFDKPIAREGWTCAKSKESFLETCSSEKEQISLRWSDRVLNRKTVHIEHPKAELQMNFFTYDEHIQDKKNLFSLDAPKNFKVLKIR